MVRNLISTNHKSTTWITALQHAIVEINHISKQMTYWGDATSTSCLLIRTSLHCVFFFKCDLFTGMDAGVLLLLGPAKNAARASCSTILARAVYDGFIHLLLKSCCLALRKMTWCFHKHVSEESNQGELDAHYDIKDGGRHMMRNKRMGADKSRFHHATRFIDTYSQN